MNLRQLSHDEQREAKIIDIHQRFDNQLRELNMQHLRRVWRINLIEKILVGLVILMAIGLPLFFLGPLILKLIKQ